jgi:esterase/lipase
MRFLTIWWKRICLALLTLVGLWLAGDLIYSRVVNARLRAWEASVSWRPDGVRKGCAAYTIGSGSVAVLLVHGFNNAPRLYDKMAPLLAELGFTVRVMRLPGAAEPMANVKRTTHEQWIAATQDELKQLRARHQKVHVVAHSLGGAITIHCLVNDSSAADRAVLLAPVLGVSSRRSPLLPTRAWHTIGNRLLLFTTVTEAPFSLDVHDPDVRDYPWQNRFVARKSIDELFAMLDKNRGKAASFRTPLMMVLSRDDQVIDWRAAQQFYDNAQSSEKRLRFMADTGHAIPIDNGWRELTREIAEFLQAQPRLAE